jgi:K+-sensing histidine kinase KdpD
MTGGGVRRPAGREAAALGLSAGLLAGGLVLASQSPPLHIHRPLSLPWWSLIALYALVQGFPVDFEFRKAAHSITLAQLPLTLGLVFLDPLQHLTARVLGTAIAAVIVKRQVFVKAAYNVATSAFELGVAVLVVGLVQSGQSFGPRLWLILFTALAAVEVVSLVSLATVWRIMAIPSEFTQMVGSAGFALVTGALFSGFALTAIAAVYTDPFMLIIVAFIMGGLAYAYRGHRRVSAQQRTTEQLYDFVKDLGPLEVHSEDAMRVLEEVRVLLHAAHLDLAVPTDTGWEHLLVSENAVAATKAPDADLLAEAVARSGRPALRADAPGQPNQMATPLVGSRRLVGILTVRNRMGDIRDFDLGDLRLLETVATELTTAFERGRLLQDLERAATRTR